MHENQRPLDPELQRAAEAYHQPPPTPRDELWLRLQHARTVRRARPSQRRTFHPLIWAAGIAAVLAIGVAIGRQSVGRPEKLPAAPIAVSQPVSPSLNTAVYRITATEYLGQAEVFLTLFRMSLQRGAVDSLAPTTARPLLATNRLLLDSPAGTDPKIRKLLEDLEVVLAQIAQLSPHATKKDLELITTGITQTRIMARLGNKAPASLPGM